MRIVYEYSHRAGLAVLGRRIEAIREVIHGIVATLSKVSEEASRRGRRLLFSPIALNRAFAGRFRACGYRPLRRTYAVRKPYGNGAIRGAFHEVDFALNGVLVEVQFGKYPFMIYDMAKFDQLIGAGHAAVGVEIVPAHALRRRMSSGVCYGEQLVHILERLGGRFPSVPVVVLLVDVDEAPVNEGAVLVEQAPLPGFASRRRAGGGYGITCP